MDRISDILRTDTNIKLIDEIIEFEPLELAIVAINKEGIIKIRYHGDLLKLNTLTQLLNDEIYSVLIDPSQRI